MKRVMVVDRSSAFLKLVEIIIARLGYGTSLAEGAETCLRLLREEKSDLILTELNLADGTGLELCQAVRNDPEIASIPIVIITTDNNEEVRQKAFESGCNDYLTKPLTVRPLFSILENLVGNRRRKHIRTMMIASADVICRGDSIRMETFNLGEGGIFLKTEAPLPVGEVFGLSLNLPGIAEPLKVEGEVLYVFGAKVPGHPPGMGVRFVDLDDDRQALLSQYVEQYVTRDVPASGPGFALPEGATPFASAFQSARSRAAN